MNRGIGFLIGGPSFLKRGPGFERDCYFANKERDPVPRIRDRVPRVGFSYGYLEWGTMIPVKGTQFPKRDLHIWERPLFRVLLLGNMTPNQETGSLIRKNASPIQETGSLSFLAKISASYKNRVPLKKQVPHSDTGSPIRKQGSPFGKLAMTLFINFWWRVEVKNDKSANIWWVFVII